MTATLHVLQDTTLRDEVAKLRELANAIEDGQYGDVGCVAVVLLGSTCEVFAFGADSDAPSAGMLLHAGFMKLSQVIADHNEETD